MSPALLFAQGDAEVVAGMGVMAFLGFACLAFLGLLLTFLPGFIAWARGHQNTAAIFVLSLLLGWTFLGWVIALVWSFTEVTTRRRRSRDYHNPFDD